MSIFFNETDVNTTYDVTYNGTSLEKIICNDTTVWEKGLYLYKYGNMCTENSGGWEYVKYLAKGYLDGNTSITYNSDRMTMVAINTGGSTNGDSSLYTKNKIDLSKYSKLCMRISGYCYRTNVSDANVVIFNTLPSTKRLFQSLCKVEKLI